MRFVAPEAIALRGGVLMTRLDTDRINQPWPDRVMVELVLEDGEERELVGHIGWIEPMPAQTPRSWGSDDRTVWIRPITPSDRLEPDNPQHAISGPRLLVTLPNDGSGTLHLGRSRLPLRWMDLPESMPAIRVGDRVREGVLEAVNAPDLPAAHNPLDWWRWELIAERRGLEPPPPNFESTVQRLAARQVSGLWRIAMERLTRESRGVAARCRDLLTETCQDGDVTIAAWITGSASLESLLHLLLDPKSTDEERVQSALSWADERISQIAWINQPFGPDVGMTLANPDQRQVLAEFIWSTGNDVPIGVRLPPKQVTRTRIQRQKIAMSDPFSRMDILNVIVRKHVQRFTLGDHVIPLVPPGTVLGPFIPSLTLADVRSQTLPEARTDRTTWLQVRRRDGHWEIYIECLLNPGPETADKTLPKQFTKPSDMIGIEAVTLLLSRSGAKTNWPLQRIAVSPHDGWRRYRSEEPDRPNVGIRTQPDRWLATVMLPDSWIPKNGDSLLLAAFRTHAGDDTFETMTTPCVPWDLDPQPVYLDPTAWDEDDEPSLRRAGSAR
ncbi:MAG: hypothetical protein VX527_06090 [Planctomycetota bacterium]|nr:hypothetical protein [Planctomycetota bacterium]